MDFDTKNEYSEAPECTQKQLMEHFGSSLNNGVCHLMATEIHEIKSPAVQTMVDNYHQSGAKSWEQWVNNSPLNNIREHHPETFDELENYQLQFTENIYAPLSQYRSSSHNIFKGTANDLIQQILAIYNHLKQSKIRPNCCMQIDLRWTHDIMIRGACNRSYVKELAGSADDGQIYQQDNVADEAEYEFKGNSMSISSRMRTFSFVCDSMIDHILSKCRLPDGDSYCYKRYEVLLDGTDTKSFEAVSNNSIPKCTFENAPLCMIFNSTASAKQILHELCKETTGLITASFHVYHRTISVYLYVSDGKGKLFGSRVFADDLISMVLSLFADGSNITQLNNDLQFTPHAAYKQYYLSLMQHAMNYNADDEDEKSSIDVFEAQLDPLVALPLEKTVTAWKSARNKSYIISKVKRCFVEYGINDDYFKTHTRKDFIQLLKAYDIKTGVAAKLWRSIAQQIHETKTDVFVVTKEQYLQKQIETHFKKIQSLESELRAAREANNNLKRVIENAMSDDHSSDDMEQSNDAYVIHLPSALANTEYVSNPVLFPPGKNSIFAVDRGFHD